MDNKTNTDLQLEKYFAQLFKKRMSNTGLPMLLKENFSLAHGEAVKAFVLYVVFHQRSLIN